MADENAPPIWERQDSDTPKSWAAFIIYRDMGAKRSLRETHDIFYSESRANLGQIFKWSTDHNWLERCEAYDKDYYEKRQERKEQLQLEVEETLESDWRAIRKLIANQLEKYEKGNLVLKSSELRDLIKMLREADDMIRRTAGLPDRISESKTDLTSGGEKITWKDFMAQALADDSDTTDS